MKFSEIWLREWVDPPVSTDDLVEQLTMAGLEVDSVEPAAPAFTGLVVGEVLAVEAHPDADKLKVCSVSNGDDTPLQVVCGAPNVHVGMKAPLALVGARMPGDFKIKKTRLRGVESSGMLCSASELGLSDDHQGLMALPVEAEPGMDIRQYLQLDDCMIEIDLTPNRGDCLGIEGVAREVGALNRCPVSPVSFEAVDESLSETFPVDVLAPEACPRYLGRVVRGIDPGAQTPLWMQERLRRGGIRSLGPVVDITNYVLLELGQPMHAFDLEVLQGGIRVRYAEEGEEITLLDETVLKLDTDTLLIADEEKALAIAGVMGGLDSGISAQTNALFLECAFFSPEKIAGRARTYSLHTDSAFRFERGVDPGLQHRALERATELLLDIVGGEAGPVIETVSREHLPDKQAVVLRADRVQRVLGVCPSTDVIRDILDRLGMVVEETGQGTWRVTPPTFRFDITMEADLIEEIGRVYGYNQLPTTRMQGEMVMSPEPEAVIPLARLRQVLVERGYQEAITYSFVDPRLQTRVDPESRPVVLANPISSGMSVMRTSLWPGLIKAAQHNINRQQNRIRMFECGLKFLSYNDDIKQINVISGLVAGNRDPEHWDGSPVGSDFYDTKGDLRALLALTRRSEQLDFQAAEHPALHPAQTAMIKLDGNQAGWVGRIHPAMADFTGLDMETCLFELETAVITVSKCSKFSEISRFPSIRRDIAIVVDEEVSYREIQNVIRESAAKLLQEIILFDVYQGKGIETGRKSIALGLILQDSSRTLTDDEVEVVQNSVTSALKDKFGANLRE